jgi:potassium-transporting ATPase KdpC subunit
VVKELKQGLLFTVVTMLLFGGVYHVALWGVGRVAFPIQTEGSLIRRPDGTIVGSRLIAQAFTEPTYFHPRPSAVDYNAASTGGSNLATSNPDQMRVVRDRLDAVMKEEGVSPDQVPSEMVTASGGGLDPDIPLAAAALQAPRVAAARRVPIERVRVLIQAHTELPTLGILGRTRVNVLELNLALDETLGAPASPASR